MIKIVCGTDSSLWDEIVKSFKDYDVYYLFGYVNSLKKHGDGEPLLIYYEKPSFRAINVVFKRPIDNYFIRDKKYFDLTTPYGYGGFVFEGEISKEEISQLKTTYYNMCIDNSIITEFTRFHPLRNENLLNSFCTVEHCGKTIAIDLKDKDTIWNNLHSKNRNQIRKAVKSGIEIKIETSNENLDRFKELYRKTMNRLNASDYYYFDDDYYKSLFHDLKENIVMAYAIFDGIIISSAIILYANESIHYHLSASDREYSHLCATNYLIYEVSCWGSSRGFRQFHLGGGLGGKEDSLYSFKKAFNKEGELDFYIGKTIFDPIKYEEILSMYGIDDINEKFFPFYRAPKQV